MKSALLVIDVQNDMFTMDNELYRPDDLLNVIRNLISKARKAGSPVIYVQHNSDRGERFRNGTEGWKVHSKIAPMDGDHIIQKKTPDSFYMTNLKDVLETEHVEKLVICGIQSELCVDTTTRAANSLDFDVTLVRDGHSTFDRNTQGSAKIVEYENEVLNGWFAQVTDSESISF